MNSLSILTIKVLRKLYAKTFGGYQLPPLQREEDPDKASEMIYNLLSNDKPCMIARFGANELNSVINYLGVNAKKHSIWKFIQGKQPEWWWNKNIMYNMQNNAGLFPATSENMQRFGELMLEDAKEVDLLGSWLKQEYYLQTYLSSSLSKVTREACNPFFSKKPWSRYLAGKNVLVIHPFEESIREQYQKRELLFENTDILPQFNLKTIKAVQSLGGNNNNFKDWFEALDWMKAEMNKTDYDICLIGCGAYGFPLAAHAKRQGKKAIHLGGSLQLLFGIKGVRWENPNYNQKYNYAALMNQYWIKPNNNEKPNNAGNVENACYW